MDRSASGRRRSHNPDDLRVHIDQEIERLQSSISDFRTHRDTLPPTVHLFDANLQNELERQIRSLEIGLQDRRSRRNSLTRIFRLPDEVLFNIFMFARESPIIKCRTGHFPQLAVCTYVCRRWRMLILASPILWSNINLSLPARWAAACFARSQSAMLDITMDMVLGRENLFSITQLVSNNSSRLRRMRVAMAIVEDWTVPLRHFTPFLEFLEVQVLQAYDPWVTFPPSLFGGQALPLLRTFGFYGPHSIWSSPLLLNLTSLKVDQYPHPRRPQINLWQVLQALQQMSRLEHLHLQGEAFPDNRENPDRIVVPLPLLTSIHLRGPIQRAAVLLDHLVMPTTVAMAVYSTTTAHKDPMKILLHFLSIHFHHSRITPECVMKFDGVMIQQQPTNIKVWIDSHDSLPPFTLELPFCSMFESALTVLCNVLPLTLVKTLCVSGYHVSRELWSLMLEKMQELEVLDMGHFACIQFPYAMVGFGNLWPLLKVHTIGLCLVDFGLAMHQDPMLLGALSDCIIHLRERQNLWNENSGLKTVEVYRCTGVEDAFVGKLRIDGFDVRVDDGAVDGIAGRVKNLV